MTKQLLLATEDIFTSSGRVGYTAKGRGHKPLYLFVGARSKDSIICHNFSGSVFLLPGLAF